MSLIEFIGFVISMAALIFLFIRRFLEQRRRALHPEEFEMEEEEQQKNLQEFLRSLKIDMEDQEQFVPPPQAPKPVVPPPPPKLAQEQRNVAKKIPRVPGQRFEFKGKLDQYHPESAIEKRDFKTDIEDRFYESFDERLLSKDFRTASTTAYDVVLLEKTPRIRILVNRLPSLREMIIIKELIGPPKSFQLPE